MLRKEKMKCHHKNKQGLRLSPAIHHKGKRQALAFVPATSQPPLQIQVEELRNALGQVIGFLKQQEAQKQAQPIQPIPLLEVQIEMAKSLEEVNRIKKERFAEGFIASQIERNPDDPNEYAVHLQRPVIYTSFKEAEQ